MKRDNHEFQFIDKVTCCKWLNWRPITMLFSNISGMQSTSAVQRWMKWSATKILVPCPDVIKMYNQGIGGIDLVDQRTSACNLDRRSSIRFYLMDAACVNTFIVCNMMHQNDLNLFEYKTIVSTNLVGWYTSRRRAPPEQKLGSKRKYQYHFERKNLSLRLPEFQHSRKRCEYCYKERFDRKKFAKCTECSVFLCIVKEWNCLIKHHF